MADAKMANAIVQEVLDFVRPIQLQVETTALAEAVAAAIQQADTKDRRGQITVDVDVSPTLPRIQADRHRLTQVFTNLLVNAYEAMHGQGHVTVRAVPTRIEESGIGRDGVLIEVADDGPGIPADVKDKVFDLFFTTKAKGSGLGLAVVRRIVDAHDGRLDLRTSAATARPSASRCPWRAATTHSVSTEVSMGRILIADDHETLRRGLAQALTEAGHEIEEAPNGNAAIEKLHEGSFDVVVSDLRMGGSTGIDVLKTAKALHPTALGDPDDRVRFGVHRRRGDEGGRVRLRPEAVRDRGDGGQDPEGARPPPHAARDRLPAAHAGRHLQLRQDHRVERRAVQRPQRREAGGQEQHHRARARARPARARS